MTPTPRGLSLRHKTVLAVAGFTAAALGVATGLAYHEVRTSADVSARVRLARVSDQLEDLIETSVAARQTLVDEVANRPSVLTALRGGPINDEEIGDAVAELRGSAERDYPLLLLDAERRAIFAQGAGTVHRPTSPPPEMRFDDEAWYSGFDRPDSITYYWTSNPMHSEGSVVGWMAQLRRIGNPSSASSLESLIGSDIHVYFAHRDGGPMVDLSGRIRAPAMPEGVSSSEVGDRELGDSTYLATMAEVDGAPWRMLVEIPYQTVLARPRTFIRRAAFIVGGLLVLTVLLGWHAGGTLTKPIDNLADAAGAMAGGDYGRRVPVDGGSDELHRLAVAFNTMAARVQASHDELEERYAEAHALAQELEEAHRDAVSAREAAQAASRAKSEFLAKMSHEIRTPINAVVGYAELLEEGIMGHLNPAQREQMGRIRRASTLLTSLVEDVLDYARLETGRLSFEIGAQPIAEAVATASAVLEPVARTKDISIDVQGDPAVEVAGDPRRLSQIVVNLMSNAVKFTDDGGTIGVSWGAAARSDVPERIKGSADAWCRLDVTDSGRGIEPERLEHMFEPFVQADSGYTRDQGGAGLGLSIARALAREMGGELTATSRVGNGSRFTLWLAEAVRGAGASEAEGARAS